VKIFNITVKVIICAVLIAALALCLCGCRARIINTAKTDKTVSDKRGVRAQQYEQNRVKFNLSDEGPADKDNNLDKKQEAENDHKKQKSKSKQKSGKNTGGKHGASKDSGSRHDNGAGDAGSGNDDGNEKTGGIDETENQKKITVRFNANGGLCGISEKHAVTGQKYGELPSPVRSGYIFTGWFTKKTGGRNITSKTIITSKKDHTLFAKWSAEEESRTYNVTFDANGGRIKASQEVRHIKYGEIYGTLPLPVKKGHDFSGWFTAAERGAGVKEGDTFTSDSDLTLYAHWKYNPYKYWSSERKSICESIYPCQITDCYIEFVSDHKTASSCSLLSDCKIGNCARNIGNKTTVTDEWVQERNPNAVIKCTADMSAASGVKQKMKQRLPNRRILIIPESAVSGSSYERLYYALRLGKAVYPDWFGNIDIDRMSRELGVSGTIYE